MNQAFDYNGVVVAQSAPKKVLRTVKKTIHIDSADRDTTKYYTNGDFWVYLPRNYQNIVSIRLKDAQFPPIVSTPLTAYVSNVGYTSSVITYSVNSTAGILPGYTVQIANVGGSGNNGIFTVATVTSASVFTVNAVGSNTGNTTGTVKVLSAGALTHAYGTGQNVSATNYNNATTPDVALTTSTYYFLVGLEGLNKVDETSVSANRSTFTDSFFAKIPVTTETYGANSFIAYNDHSALENIATYSPPIENLDRLHVVVRTHSQQNKDGFMYWTSDGQYASFSTGNIGGAANFNLTLEIEYLENAFTDFSSFETRLSERS